VPQAQTCATSSAWASWKQDNQAIHMTNATAIGTHNSDFNRWTSAWQIFHVCPIICTVQLHNPPMPLLFLTKFLAGDAYM
jgi:hypothetical protein